MCLTNCGAGVGGNGSGHPFFAALLTLSLFLVAYKVDAEVRGSDFIKISKFIAFVQFWTTETTATTIARRGVHHRPTINDACPLLSGSKVLLFFGLFGKFAYGPDDF